MMQAVTTFRRGRVVQHGSRERRCYLARLEHVAWAHLTTLSCCATLLDAIAHVTRLGNVVARLGTGSVE
jgi:hypothetical protein